MAEPRMMILYNQTSMNKGKRWLGAVLMLLALVACSQRDKGQLDVLRVHTPVTTHSRLTLSLDVEPMSTGLRSIEALPTEARSAEVGTLPFRIEDGVGHFLWDDEGKPTTTPSKRARLDRDSLAKKAAQVKFLIQVRKGKAIVGQYFGPLTYVPSSSHPWRLNELDMPLTDVAPGDKLEVRAVAGGSIDAEARELRLDKPAYAVADGNGTVQLPVPYASDWMPMRYDAAKKRYVLTSSNGADATQAPLRLKPLGMLLVSTLRREDNPILEGVSVSGLRYVTNALMFQGRYKLDGADSLSFSNTGESRVMPVTDETFYTATYHYDAPVTPTTMPSSKMIVAWAVPLPKRLVALGQIITARKNKNTPISTFDMAMKASLLHVYAEGVTKGGQPLGKPNYAIVPVMGSNKELKPRTSVSVNAELSVPPPNPLGYMAKYTIRSDGEGFDRDHTNQGASLVNWTVAAQYAFPEGKAIPGYAGRFHMCEIEVHAMMGIVPEFIYPKHSIGNGTPPYGGRMITAGGYKSVFMVVTGRDGQKNSPFPYTSVEKGLMLTGTKVKGSVLTNVHDATNERTYSLMAQDSSVYNAGVATNRSKSRSTILICRDYEALRGVTEREKGNLVTGRITLYSLSLGKYFIGNAYSPIYHLQGILAPKDKPLWREEGVKPGMVMRYVPAAGLYENIIYPTSTSTADERSALIPADTHRIDAGKVVTYWYKLHDTEVIPINNGGFRCWVSKLMLEVSKLQDKSNLRTIPEWEKDISRMEYGYEPVLSWDAVNYNRTKDMPGRDCWLTLWPYSDVYQGDDPD